MGIGGVSVPLEEKSRDAQVASYTGIYDTEGVAHTKSGERQPIQVNMQVCGSPSLAWKGNGRQEGVKSQRGENSRAQSDHSCCPSLCFVSVGLLVRCSWKTQALLPKGKPMEQQRPGSSCGISRDLQSPLGCCSRKKYELNHPPLLHPQS